MYLPIARILFIAAFVAICAVAADSQTELKSQAELFQKAAAARDAAAMDGLLADDYLLITRTGILNTKKQFLDRMRAGTTPGGGKYGTSKRVYSTRRASLTKK